MTHITAWWISTCVKIKIGGTYLTRPLMSLCVHDRQGWLHGHLRATYFPCPLPIFTDNVLPEIFHTSRQHFLRLQIMAIAINLSLIHVNCPLRKPMMTTSYFKSFPINLCSSPRGVLCCLSVWFVAHTIIHILKE